MDYDSSIGRVNDQINYHTLNRALLISYLYTVYKYRSENFERDSDIILIRLNEKPGTPVLPLSKIASLYDISSARCAQIVHRVIRGAKAYYRERGIILVTRSPTAL